VPLRIGNYTAITSDVYKDLELSAARVSQLKREGRFDGAWVKENGVLLWDLEDRQGVLRKRLEPAAEGGEEPYAQEDQGP
jgi:hypothetical protein